MPNSEELREALQSAEAWLNRWAKHVGTCRGYDLCTCGLTAIRAEASKALLSQSAGGDGWRAPRANPET